MKSRGYLGTLPELELFPTLEQRDQAVREIEAVTRPGWRVTWGWAKPTLITLPFYVCSLAIILWMMSALRYPAPPWDIRIANGVAIMSWIVARTHLVNRSIPRAIRIKLLDVGVAVCLQCGYGLQGLPVDTTRCPECGKRLDARVTNLIAASGVKRSRGPGLDVD